MVEATVAGEGSQSPSQPLNEDDLELSLILCSDKSQTEPSVRPPCLTMRGLLFPTPFGREALLLAPSWWLLVPTLPFVFFSVVLNDLRKKLGGLRSGREAQPELSSTEQRQSEQNKHLIDLGLRLRKARWP